jgi:anti-anti-sigma factor
MQTKPEGGIEFWTSIAPAAGGGSVVTVIGELDISTAAELKPVLQEALDGDGDVELDLRGCGFVDSSGIAVLAWAAWQLKDGSRRLVLRGAKPRIRSIFELTGLARHSSVVLEPDGD